MPENRERIVPQETIRQQTEKQEVSAVMVDLQKEKDITIPPEVRNWMRKMEEDPVLNQNSQKIKGDDDLVLQPIATTTVKITLPTDKKSFTGGFSKPVDNAWKWLSTFILRIIKKNEGKVKFKEE
ncbi:MAG: hypothetical protein KIH89_002390 [Candidatus Shapirobacteria bacterium]|nr:hypothetical protein [Candidatus Shapirobacteria bacterium]